MKKTLLIFTFMVSMCTSTLCAQLDTLFFLSSLSYDTAGFAYYAEETVKPGQLFPMYQTFTGDHDNDLELHQTFEDSIIHFVHYFHQQTYKGLNVEGAHYIEHAKDGFVVYANGKLSVGLDIENPYAVAPEIEALYAIFAAYPDNAFAWMNDDWETQIQTDLGDSTATYYPHGELMLALDSYDYIPVFIPAERYRLAWRFEVISLEPYFHKAIFVDALTATIFREDELDMGNGPAVLYYNQNRTIDTQWDGSISKHILVANDNGRSIHTKHGVGFLDIWGFASNYHDGNDVWGTNDMDGTSAHWFTSESWDFFQEAPYFRWGMDNAGSEVRVSAEIPAHQSDFAYNDMDQIRYIRLGFPYNRAIDVVGHEFSHGVIVDRAMFEGEARSLNESFCDIFGELIEFRSEGGAIDWIHGIDPVVNNDTTGGAHPYLTRNLEAPKTDYYHFTNAQCSTAIGQPNTYQGINWDFGTFTDCKDSHINNGVHNFWFHLLAEGGAGTIDDNNIDAYSIEGIGHSEAAIITYLNFTTNLVSTSSYLQARTGAITIAALRYQDICAFETIQVQNAWHAVGLGPESNCQVAVNPVQNRPSAAPIVYPNPSFAIFQIDFDRVQERTVIITDILGKTVAAEQTMHTKSMEVDLSHMPIGMYFVTIREKSCPFTLKLIKK